MLSPKQTSHNCLKNVIALLFLGVSKILHQSPSPHDSLAVAPASIPTTRYYTKLTSHDVHYRYPPCPRWGCSDWKCCCCQGRGSPLLVTFWEASFGCRIGCMPGASSPRVNSRGAPLQTIPTWNNPGQREWQYSEGFGLERNGECSGGRADENVVAHS